jgi:ASC-1-like (ASCH) protein
MSPQSAGRRFDMNLQGRYFLLLASARKDIEVRVLYPKYRALGPGDFIRFSFEQQARLTIVERVVTYGSFEELLDSEDPVRIDPDATWEQQLRNLRQIYGPEKEALGVLAIQVQLA